MWTEKIKFALAICGLALCLALFNPFSARGQQENKSSATATAAAPQQPKDYSRFTHQSHQGMVKIPNTNFARELKCDSCHERPDDRQIAGGIVATTDRNKQLRLKFPAH
jgi:hypothetical protein